MNSKYIVYVGNFDFSEKIAAGKRVLGISCALRDLGYNVILIGADKETKNNIDTINTKHIVDGFETYMLPYPLSQKDWISYKKQYSRVINLLEKQNIIDNLHAVIIYGSPCLSLWGYKLFKWCKKREIKLITDVVDWIAGSSGSLLFRIVKWMDTTYSKTYLNKRVDGVIAISRFLADYYRSKNCRVIEIPPITDIYKYKFIENSNHTSPMTKLVYVGMPFGKQTKISTKKRYKDRLDIVIELLGKVREKTDNFIFNIYGITKNEYLNSLPEHANILKKLEKNVFFHGKIANDLAVQKIHESDFSILLRDNNIVSTAGFPTKVTESITCGTPVITNKTSNLEEYIIDGVNGFWLENFIVDGVKKLELIIGLSQSKKIEMKNNCMESRIFHYQNFEIKLNEFMEK